MARRRRRGAGLLVPDEAACPCASTPLLVVSAYYISPRRGCSGLQVLVAINGFGIWPYALRETQRSLILLIVCIYPILALLCYLSCSCRSLKLFPHKSGNGF
jgi:hypothetical protein